MPSADEHAEAIEEYIRKEVAAGRIIGPLGEESTRGVHINRLGAVPKGTGRWRVITDLSFPPGASVNDGVDSTLCSLRYTSVDRVASAACRLGRGAMLAKLDIKSAYRLLPVHPDDRPLLGLQWRGSSYMDGMLPFGLRSAPKIFTAVADALEWCLRQEGVAEVDHYLDDFVTLGPAQSPVCGQNLSAIKSVCHRLGVPLAVEKLAGPATCLEFLGIVIDTAEQELRLPRDKLVRLQCLTVQWADRRSCRRRDLESLAGVLNHAATVIRPGRSFLQGIFDLLRTRRRTHQYIRLNQYFRADLSWWRAFAADWNGRALLPPPPSRKVEFASDASGSWGCGAWSGTRWLQVEWPQTGSEHITFKELAAAIIALAVWGPEWRGQHVQGKCDNQAAVQVVAARLCRDRGLMHLLRCLFFLEAHYQCSFSLVHIPGVHNSLADDLSRNRASSFLRKVSAADPLPSPVSPTLVELLRDPQADWTSASWTRRFSSTVGRV